MIMLASAEAELKACAGRCRFEGFHDWEALPKFYAAADFLCAPSRHDGWGLIVPEALASGLPVITTENTGSGVEFIKSGKNGWLIQAGSESQLLGALRKAARISDVELQTMSQHATTSVNAHSLDHGVARFHAAADAAIQNWQ